jgi:hypothetical protein
MSGTGGTNHTPIMGGRGRPSAPSELGRTLLSNRLINVGKANQMFINQQSIPPNEAALYRLFAPETLVGAYEFTWHHNIPWNELRDSWDIIITFCTPAIITRLFDLYTRDHVLAKTSGTPPARLLQKILALREAAGPAQADDATSGLQNKSDRMTGQQWLTNMAGYRFPSNRSQTNFNSTDHDALPLFICWDGWNLVEGPSTTIRTEDPGEMFDDFSAADPDTSHNHRYGCVARLHDTLIQIINDFNTQWATTPCNFVQTTITWSRAMDETLTVCESLTSDERKAIFYARDMWAPVSMWGPINKAGAAGDPMTVQVNSVTCWRQAKRARA